VRPYNRVLVLWEFSHRYVDAWACGYVVVNDRTALRYRKCLPTAEHFVRFNSSVKNDLFSVVISVQVKPI